jgi:hypothetical protein
MTNPDIVYWKIKEGENEEYISGTCRRNDVPIYGEVKNLALPNEIEIVKDEEGSTYIYSPPVFGAKKAYRLTAHLHTSQLDHESLVRSVDIDSVIKTQRVDAPLKGTSRENWWWYSHDRFEILWYGDRTPIRLLKKWKGPMIEAILKDHPEKDKILSEWNDKIESHRQHVSEINARRPKVVPKQNGDLVVLPQPCAFARGRVKQIFTYNIEERINGRDKHSLVIKGARCKTPHSVAMPFHRGLAPSEALSHPIKTSIILISWAMAPKSTSHDIMSAKAEYSDRAYAAISELKSWTKRLSDSEAPSLFDFEAARSALEDFSPKRPSDDDNPLTRMAAQEVLDAYNAAIQIMHTAINVLLERQETW